MSDERKNRADMMTSIARKAVHAVTRNRRFYYRRLEAMGRAGGVERILEIGSGKPSPGGQHPYSAVHIFPNVTEFRMTDVNPDHGHEVLDLLTMDISDSYDLILCLNVLEHVYEFGSAVDNLHRALVGGGRLVVAVPFAFPLHDEPHDYWRFTRFALDRMFGDFDDVAIETNGPSKFPFGHFVVATKSAHG